MEENQTPGKQDMVDRKAAWIERMFDRLFLAFQKDLKGALLIIAIGVIIWQQYAIIGEKQARLDDNKVSKKEMIDEVRRNMEIELPKRIAPIQATQDSIGKNVDTSLLRLNGTLETVKKLIKSKK